MNRLYVYALVPRGLSAMPLGTGICGEALRVAALGEVDAVLGEMEGRPSIGPTSFGAHDDVVRRVGAKTDAILPFPFGAMVADVAELRDGLAPRGPALAETLERVRGCDQMTLRLYAEGEPDPTRIRDAMASLVRAESVESARPEVSGESSSPSPSPRRPPGESPRGPLCGPLCLRATFFHLVGRERVEEYRARVQSLSVALAPGRMEATGPWPPYAFLVIQ